MKRKYTEEELKDKKHNHLTLRERTIKEEHGKKRGYWKCECVCGKIVERRESIILSPKNISCGCMHSNKFNKASSSKIWRGCGKLGAQHFNAIAQRARKLEIPFEITIEEAWNKFLQQEEKCALTGRPLEFNGLRQQRAGQEQTASLDRIDSTKGYTVENIQWIHKHVNVMKHHYDQKYFIEICKEVTEYHGKMTSKVPLITA